MRILYPSVACPPTHYARMDEGFSARNDDRLRALYDFDAAGFVDDAAYVMVKRKSACFDVLQATLPRLVVSERLVKVLRDYGARVETTPIPVRLGEETIATYQLVTALERAEVLNLNKSIYGLRRFDMKAVLKSQRDAEFPPLVVDPRVHHWFFLHDALAARLIDEKLTGFELRDVGVLYRI